MTETTGIAAPAARLARVLFWAAAAGTLLLHYGCRLPRELGVPDERLGRRDFFIYYHAARALDAGEPLYRQTTMPGQPVPLVWRPYGYFYPPGFAAALLPLARLPPRVAWCCWRGLNEICLAAGIAALVWLARGHPNPARSLAWLAVALTLPITWRTLRLGQVDPLLLALVAGALLAADRRRDGLAGTLLALAAAAKFYPGLLFVYFALRRRWRTVGVGLAVLAASAAVGIAAAGWAAHVVYLNRVVPLLAEPTVMVDNVSLYAVSAQWLLLTGHLGGEQPAPPGLKVLHLLSVAAILALVAWRWRFAPRHDPRTAALSLGAGTVAALLAGRLCWSIYLCLMLVPAVLLWEWTEPGRGGRGRRAWLVAFWALLAAGTYLITTTPWGLPYTELLPLAAAWGVFGLSLYPARG